MARRALVDLWEDARVEVDVGELLETREDLQRAIVCVRRLQRIGQDMEVELLRRRGEQLTEAIERAPSTRRRIAARAQQHASAGPARKVRVGAVTGSGAAPAPAAANAARCHFCRVVHPPGSGCEKACGS